MIKLLIIVLMAELWNCAGHILLKKSANSIELQSLTGIKEYAGFIKKVIAKPSIWAGLVLMGISLFIWIIALGAGDVSVVYSIGSIQYVLILFLAPVFLNEKLDKMKVLGTLFVVAGIILITIS